MGVQLLYVYWHHVALQPKGALAGVLGQPAGLRDCVRLSSCLSSRCSIHLTHQCDRQPLAGPGHGHHELPHLQVRPRRCEQEPRGAPVQGFRAWSSFLTVTAVMTGGTQLVEAFLDVDIRIPEAQLTAAVENAGARINGLLAALKAAILVENLVESAKFAVGMYLVSYLGKLMTGLTLVTLVWAGIFSLPRIYKDNQAKIDEALMPLLTKYEELAGKVSAALPASVTGKKEE